MKLSEAIRLGAMLKPQAFGSSYGHQLKRGIRGWLLREREITSCAFAAALEAHPCGTKHVYGTVTAPLRGAMMATDGEGSHEVIDLPPHWLDVVSIERPCPACGDVQVYVYNLISHLNDTHRWTREQIADWVETIEAQQAIPDDAQPVPVSLKGV